jgi:hypothetical protein
VSAEDRLALSAITEAAEESWEQSVPDRRAWLLVTAIQKMPDSCDTR